MTPPFADAARITPYPFVAHQVPSSPDSADASRTTKKKRQRPRAERNPQQEEDVRFNTGPVRYAASGPRRGSRQAGRSYPDDRNGKRSLAALHPHYSNFTSLGIPDYPPPSFQEAINTPLSQSSISLVTAPMSSIPEDNQDDESPAELIPTTRRMEIDPLNEVAPMDYTSESDDSALVIVNKNEVPVCFTDFPPAKHENKKDWFKRRKQDTSISSTSTVEKSGGVARGRKLPRITIPINPDPSGMHEQETMSSPKRRFLSLSPIKTIFPSKTVGKLDRPLSATSSPSSPKFSLGNRNFFRSTNSLTLLRLSGSQNKDPLSRRLFIHKGKERAMEPVIQENLQDNWEVVEQATDGERGEGIRPEVENHPQSLMSVVIDSFSANGSTTTLLKIFPTKRSRSTRSTRSTTTFDGSESVAPTTATNGNSDTISPQTLSPPFEPRLEGQKSPDQKTNDTPLTSGSPTPVANTPTASPSQGSPSEHLISSKEGLSPPTALQSLHVPLPAQLRPNVTTNPKAMEGDVSKHDLETLLPMTPVYQTYQERNTPSAIDELKEKLPQPLVPVAVWSSPAASRSIPDLLTDSDHTPSLHALSGCSCGTRHNVNASFSSIPSPLGMHMYPSFQMPTPPQFTLLSKASAGEEPLSPSRPPYAGRPLPRPPPIPDVQRTIINPVLTVNTLSVARKSIGPPEDIHKEGKGQRGEGLLIDLEDTSLDTNPLLSPTTTLLSASDESHYHSQVYLPLMSSPSSSTIFPRDPLTSHISFSPSSIQSTSTVVIPGSNHLTSCPQHRYQYQHNHRFPYLLSRHQDPNVFSKSNLDLPSRFRDGIHESSQSDLHHGYPQGPAGGGSLSHCCSCEHSVMPWSTQAPPPAMPVTHGVYQPHYHHHMTMDNGPRQRHHLSY